MVKLVLDKLNNASGNNCFEKIALPVRTAEVIKSILDASKKDSKGLVKKFDVSLIQNFGGGTAINDLLYPDRV